MNILPITTCYFAHPTNPEAPSTCNDPSYTSHVELLFTEQISFVTLHIMSFLCFSIIHMEKCKGATKFQLECQGSENPNSKSILIIFWFICYMRSNWLWEYSQNKSPNFIQNNIMWTATPIKAKAKQNPENPKRGTISCHVQVLIPSCLGSLYPGNKHWLWSSQTLAPWHSVVAAEQCLQLYCLQQSLDVMCWYSPSAKNRPIHTMSNYHSGSRQDRQWAVMTSCSSR